MIETFVLANFVVMAVNFYRSTKSLNQRLGHLFFYFLLVIFYSIIFKLIQTQYNVAHFEYARFELSQTMSFITACLLRFGIYITLASLFKRNYKNKVAKLFIHESIVISLGIFTGIEFVDIVISSFLIVTWGILTTPEIKKSKIIVFEHGNVVPIKPQKVTELAICPLDRMKQKKLEISKRPMDIGLTSYLTVQVLLLAYLFYKFVLSFEFALFDERLIYSVFFILSLSSLSRVVERRTLVLSEIIRQLLFIIVESSYWENAYGPIGLKTNLPIVMMSFVSLNWYLIVNSQEIMRRLKRLFPDLGNK